MYAAGPVSQKLRCMLPLMYLKGCAVCCRPRISKVALYAATHVSQRLRCMLSLLYLKGCDVCCRPCISKVALYVAAPVFQRLRCMLLALYRKGWLYAAGPVSQRLRCMLPALYLKGCAVCYRPCIPMVVLRKRVVHLNSKGLCCTCVHCVSTVEYPKWTAALSVLSLSGDAVQCTPCTLEVELQAACLLFRW
ncbi:hypothetical protein NDU88_001098 [Pleurodeles waltl]|uniref:Uncharacterized protein n=1 Tax=Pleurodeles waltl TaxID=8319 RepID=A0AAV7P7R4_PLEWA|nr:hypothetical protein NDU88_001098 [Pleurodeles waltl]